MSSALLIALALALDYLLGEPPRYHPLVGFGRLVDAIEARLNGAQATTADGVFGWCLAVIPLLLLAFAVDFHVRSDPEYPVFPRIDYGNLDGILRRALHGQSNTIPQRRLR